MAALRNANFFCKNCNNNKILNLNPSSYPLFIVPLRTAKHYDPKWKWLRGQKTHFYDKLENEKKLNYRERMRTKMKLIGMLPPRYWEERPITLTSLNEILKPYLPPEGDGKTSFLSKNIGKKALETLANKKDYLLALKKIKSYDSEFNVKIFPQMAQDIYVKAHTCLMKKDYEELLDFATDKAVTEMVNGIKYQTIRWNFIKSLEPPVVVHVVVSDILVKSNVFAQITVRFHTQQTLAVYDRFGRLIYGSESIPKDVLEYAVFEKHIVNEYGVWRLHGKIIPDWMAPQVPSARTYRVEALKEEEEDENFLGGSDYWRNKAKENLADAEESNKFSTQEEALTVK